MRHRCQFSGLLAVIVTAAMLTGCGAENPADPAPVEISGLPPAGPGGPGLSHEHAAESPHGGRLIELGSHHKFHAELVENDDTETLTVYILDAHLQELAIEQPAVTLSLAGDGSPKSFELAAVAQDGGPRSSRFESSDAGLFQKFKQDRDVKGKLRVTIEGTPYVGKIEHHDHEKNSKEDHGHTHD